MSQPAAGGTPTSPPPMSPPPTPPSPASSPYQQPAMVYPSFPIVVHYNRTTGLVMIVAGILLAAGQLAVDQPPFAIMITVIGVPYLFGKLAIVDPNLVSIRSVFQLTIRKRPIHGLSDLYFKGNKLYRRSDNRKIQNLGWYSSNPADLNRLKQAVAAAQPLTVSPPAFPPQPQP